MINQQVAAQHLKVIRSLMERATIYRTISGPTALFGSILTLGTSGAIGLLTLAGAPIGAFNFVTAWLVVLILTTAFNFTLIHRDAVRRNEPFVSPGMRLALRTIIPPMFVGGILGITLALYLREPAFAAVTWILCYGLALCATAGFAPKSIKFLGAAFILSGTALLFLWLFLTATGLLPSALTTPSPAGPIPSSVILTGAAFMGLTFGLLHLVYAVCVGFKGPLPQQRHDDEDALA